jgi:monoamine oxidase
VVLRPVVTERSGSTLDADFCVVGAGFAGLTAALRLVQVGRSVVVLEARDRVGGRVWTDRLSDGTRIERGGAWVGVGQDRLYALAAEMGLETYPTFTGGANLFVDRGRVHRYRGLVPSGMSWLSVVSLGVALHRLDAMAKRVPLDAPWDAPGAAALDARTIASWIDSPLRVPGRAARAALREMATEMFASDPAEVSLLHLLFHLHSAGGSARHNGVKGGAQQDRVVGGMHGVAQRIAARLGDAVRLGVPVSEIRQTDAGVTVVADGATVRARRAAVALPPALAGHVRYEPKLPAEQALLLHRLPAGSSWKFILVYEDAFWRADGLSGLSLALGSPVPITIDACGATAPPGILNAFAIGPEARALARMDATRRRRTVLEDLAVRFGPRAASPRHWVEQDWTDEEWTRGCFMAHYAPGVMTQLGRVLREPFGRVHWAGTETSPVWNGFIDGAVRSGERVADEMQTAESAPSLRAPVDSAVPLAASSPS